MEKDNDNTINVKRRMILSRMYTFLNNNRKIYDRIWKGGGREFGMSSSGIGVRTCTILGG